MADRKVSPEDRIHDSIARIYDAALDASLWPSVLAELCDHATAAACHIFVYDRHSGGVPFTAVGRYPREAEEEYLRDYAPFDRRVERGLSLPSDRLFTTTTLMSETELKRCPVHNECLRKWGLYWTMGKMRHLGSSETLVYSALRPETMSLFGAEEMRRWFVFLPHVERAIEITRRLGDAGARSDVLLDAVDRLATGVLTVDAQGRVVDANVCARRMLGDNDGIRAPASFLQARRTDETNTLRRMIGSAARSRNDSDADAGGRMWIARPSGKRPYSLLVAPRSRQRDGRTPGSGMVIVLISDPERAPRTENVWLHERYGLTPAETRLAQALVAGRSLREYADQAHLTIETVRSTLKAVFHKTDTHNQAGLIRKLLLEAVEFRGDGDET